MTLDTTDDPLKPLFAQTGRSRWIIRYARSDIAPTGIADDDLARIKSALLQLPGAMHGELTTLDIKGPLAAVRGQKTYRLRVGDWRVIFTSEPDGVTIFEIHRRQDDTYSRADRLATVRRGRGIAFVHVIEPAEATQPSPERALESARRPAQREDTQNPLTPFDHRMLTALGLDDATISDVRGFSPSIVVAEELAARGADVDTVELVSDVWHDPARYLEIFASGRGPTLADATMADDELAARLAHPDSSESVAALGAEGLDLVLARDIEEWMFYLHPSQARTVTTAPTGPARIKGGPGTGKTVAALHRARYLVESEQATSVLLTTFVSSLPPVWSGLLERFAPASARAVATRTLDSLAMEIVKGVDGDVTVFSADERRAAIAVALEHEPQAQVALGGTMQFEEEIDRVIAGRALRSLDEYLDAPRRGRGLRLDRGNREAVWRAYERYTSRMRKDGRCDWAHLRLRALELALEGRGPRFDAVVVDEAQDITEAGVRLLMALDTSENHGGLMLVGDGRQSIYPGGFSLRSVGLDVRGRSFVLRTNWRNTQAIMRTAELALGQDAVADLGEDLDLRGTEGSLPRRFGRDPRLHIAESSSPEEVLVAVVSELLEHTPAGDIAVLARTNKRVTAAQKALRGAGLPVKLLRDYVGAHEEAVRCGTFAYSKGLEFKAVVLFGVDSSSWAVRPFWLQDREDQSEWWANERRTLFVAMTRARDALDLVGAANLGRPIIDARSTCEEWSW